MKNFKIESEDGGKRIVRLTDDGNVIDLEINGTVVFRLFDDGDIQIWKDDLKKLGNVKIHK